MELFLIGVKNSQRLKSCKTVEEGRAPNDHSVKGKILSLNRLCGDSDSLDSNITGMVAIFS